jgi:hypothetical protein
MTARAARLAGAILLEASGDWYLIGNPKEPCDWEDAGFDPPPEIDATRQPSIRLNGAAHMTNASLLFTADGIDGSTLTQILASRLLIRRNGSVSERLWRIVTGEQDESDAILCTDATWLITLPDRVWDIVRDTALKCL